MLNLPQSVFEVGELYHASGNTSTMIQCTFVHLDTTGLINLCNSIIPEEFTVPQDSAATYN